MKKGIIYDFDGVICDSVNIKTLAFSKMYEIYGNDIVNKVVNYHHENGGISRFKKIEYFHKNFLNINLTISKINELANEFSNLVVENVIKSNYIEGAYDFIKSNKEKYLQFICTGTPKEEIDIILKERNISHFFNDVFGSPTSKTEIILTILDKYNLNRNELIFIGDALTDYNAADEVGLDFIGIKSNHTEFPNGTLSFDNFKQINIF